MKYFLYIFTSYFLLFSCESHSENWVKFHLKELRERNERFEHMLFINNKTGFLLGSYTPDKAFENKEFLTGAEAVIYKTVDGGKSWKRSALGKGIFCDALAIKGVIYAAKDSFVENSYNRVVRKIYSSRNLGESWIEIRNSSFLLKEVFINSTQKTAIVGDSLFVITPFRNSLSATHLITKQTGNISLPKKFRPEMLRIDKGKLWIVGYENKKLVFLERAKKGFFKKIYFDIVKCDAPIVFDFNVVDNNISLIVGEEATLIGVTKKFYKSINKGKSWVIEEMPSSLYVKPVAFYGKDKVWIYCGAALIQIRQ